MNELSGGSETTTATGSETRSRWESTDRTGRHAGAGDGFQSEDEALEALLAREDLALEKAQGKEDRDLDALLAEEDRELDAFLAEGDRELDAFLAEEDRELDALLAEEDWLLESSQGQRAPGDTSGDNPGLDDEASLGAESGGDSGTLTAEAQDTRDGEERAQGNSPGEADARDGSGDEAADTLDQGADEQAAGPEQPPASTDRHPAGASTPERGADEPGTPQEQDAVLAGREGAREGNDAKRAERTSWRRAAVAETIGIAGALVDAVDVVKAIAAHAPGDMLLPVAATVLGAVAVGKGIIEKRKGNKE